MSSVYVVCWIFLQTFQTYFCIQANSVDPDQTASKGAIWSGSTLFAKMIFKITSRRQSRRQQLWLALQELNMTFWMLFVYFSTLLIVIGCWFYWIWKENVRKCRHRWVNLTVDWQVVSRLVSVICRIYRGQTSRVQQVYHTVYCGIFMLHRWRFRCDQIAHA